MIILLTLRQRAVNDKPRYVDAFAQRCCFLWGRYFPGGI